MAYAMTAFSMSLLTWLAWNGQQDGQLHLLIASGCLWLLGAIFFIYVGAATTDDLISLASIVRGGLPDRRDKERADDT